MKWFAGRDRSRDTVPIDTREVRDQARRTDASESYFRRRSDEEPETHSDPAHKPHKGCGSCLMTLFVLIVVIGIAGSLAYLFFWDQSKASLSVPAAEEGNRLRSIEGDGDVLFLLVGVDDTGAGDPQRTDTMMLFRFIPSEGRLVGLSIPRDTRVYVDGELDKINHAHAYGGIDLTVQTVRDFLGLDLDYYVEVDYETVKAMIDAGGGVRYDVPEDAEPVEGEVYRTGDHVLDGTESLSYLRHRQGYADGDMGRVSAQQAFLKEAMHQLASPARFYRLPLLMHAFASHAKTNLPALPFAGHAIGAFRALAGGVEMHTLPGEGDYIDGVSYFIADSEGTLALVRDLFAPYVE